MSRSDKSDEELDHTPMTVGKYKGQSPSQIAEHDPGYIVWVAENYNEHIMSEALIKDCKDEL